MSPAPGPRPEAARHVGSVEVADRRGRAGRAAAGWGGECGSWVSEAGARGNALGPQARGACEQAPGGPRRTWPPSCAGG